MREGDASPSVQQSGSYSPLLPLFPVPSGCEFHIGNYLSRPRVGHVRMKSLWQSGEGGTGSTMSGRCTRSRSWHVGRLFRNG